MITIGCIVCGKEFKVSGEDFKDRKLADTPDLCNVCRDMPLKKVEVMKEKEDFGM